jgi:WD40 repeat protein
MPKAHDGPVNSVAFTPNGLHVISAGSLFELFFPNVIYGRNLGNDNKVKVWDAESGANEMVNFSGITRNTSKQQKQFAISNDSNILFFPNGWFFLFALRSKSHHFLR